MGDPARALDTGVAWLVVTAAAVLGAPTAVGLLLTGLARLPGAVGRACEGAARRVTPAVVRRLLVGGVGLGLTATPAVAVAAPTAVVGADRWPDLDRGPRAGTLPLLDRGMALARPAAAPERTAAPGAGTRPARSVVVVRDDDTLWRIAARHLGPGASDVAIDREWRRWYRANRAVIGPDPDVIVPGQRLVPPTA